MDRDCKKVLRTVVLRVWENIYQERLIIPLSGMRSTRTLYCFTDCVWESTTHRSHEMHRNFVADFHETTKRMCYEKGEQRNAVHLLAVKNHGQSHNAR